jgi:hypothetical protein
LERAWTIHVSSIRWSSKHFARVAGARGGLSAAPLLFAQFTSSSKRGEAVSENVFRRNGTGHFVLERLHASARQQVASRQTAPRPTDDKARKLFEQATRELERKALAAAETSLRLSLTFNPNDGEAKHLLEKVKAVREEERRGGSNLKIGG